MQKYISYFSLALLASVGFSAISMEKRTPPEGTSKESTPSFIDPSVRPLIETMQNLLRSDQPNDGASTNLSAQLARRTDDAQMKDLVVKLQSLLPAYTNFLGVFSSVAQEEQEAYTIDLKPFAAAASTTKISLDDALEYLSSPSFSQKHTDFMNNSDALYNNYLSKAKPVLVQRYLGHPACNRLMLAIQSVDEHKTKQNGQKLFESATALRVTLERLREKASANASGKMDPTTFFTNLQK